MPDKVFFLIGLGACLARVLIREARRFRREHRADGGVAPKRRTYVGGRAVAPKACSAQRLSLLSCDYRRGGLLAYD